MTIIAGLINKNCGLVASDGRIFRGADFIAGKIVRKAEIEDNEFDKTFTLYNGRIIGAVSGTVKFQEKSITTHLEEILATECQSANSLDGIINCLVENLRVRIEAVPKDEIIFECRGLDIIFIGSLNEDLGDLRMFWFRLKPKGAKIEIVEKDEIIPPVNPNFTNYKLFGDDTSQKIVDELLHSELKRFIPSERSLRSLSYKAIRLGIKYSQKHSFGDDLTCGGKPFVKSIKR